MSLKKERDIVSSYINKHHKSFSQHPERDKFVKKELRKKGWKIVIVWECKTKNPEILKNHLFRYLHQ